MSPPRLEGVQYATGEEQRITINSSRKKRLGQSENDAQWKFDCVC